MPDNSETELLLLQTDIQQMDEEHSGIAATEIIERNYTEFKLELDDGENCRSYILNKEVYSIGRDPLCSITINDRYISSQHAFLQRVTNTTSRGGFTYQVSDGDSFGNLSTNGVYVNKKRIKNHCLTSGDILHFGPNIKARFEELPFIDRLSRHTSSNSATEISEREIFYSIVDPCITINMDGEIIDSNSAAHSKLNYHKEEILGNKFSNILLVGQWKDEFRRIIERFSVTHDSSILGRWKNVEILRKNGNVFESELSVNSVKFNKDYLLVVTFRDITANNLKKTEILNKIYEDSLTGLGNRRFFLKKLEVAFQERKDGNCKEFIVLFIDLDRFKTVNDTLGHKIGDELLIQVAHRLKKCLRDNDVIARQGGDEFTVLIEDESAVSSIESIAKRLRESLNKPYSVSSHQVFVTASIGILISSEEYATSEEMLRDADFAMYSAKSSGGGGYIIFDNHIGQQASHALRIEQELRHALDRHEFSLVYQPVIALSSDSLTGFEALLRWNHADLGSISPGEFIPVAEKSGHIIPIGHWVLSNACQQIKAWQARHPKAKDIYVSVNLSIMQLEQPNIVRDIACILEQTYLDPKCLKIEITETLLMENIQDARFKLNELQKMGIQVYIDDFGTGYSSFKYLHDLPINALKIDRSFVDKLDKSGGGNKITQSIISLAGVLGIEAIAEGVETIEQLNLLTTMQCDKVQGYYFSKPLDVKYAERFLDDHLTR